MARPRKASTAIATVQCIGCKGRKDIDPAAIPKDSMPTCDKCYLPMVVVKVRSA